MHMDARLAAIKRIDDGVPYGFPRDDMTVNPEFWKLVKPGERSRVRTVNLRLTARGAASPAAAVEDIWRRAGGDAEAPRYVLHCLYGAFAPLWMGGLDALREHMDTKAETDEEFRRLFEKHGRRRDEYGLAWKRTYEKPPVIVPGDRVQLTNSNPEHGPFQDAMNLVYLGNKEFWGHTGGEGTTASEKAWRTRIRKNWGEGDREPVWNDWAHFTPVGLEN